MGIIVKSFFNKIGAIPKKADEKPEGYINYVMITLPEDKFLCNYESRDLRKANKLLNKELKKRATKKHNECDKLRDGWQSFANFMACACTAMSARATLRLSMDLPALGIHPQSGEMWTPSEIYFAYKRMRNQATSLGLPAHAANPLGHEYYEPTWINCVHQCLGLSEVTEDTSIPF